MLLTTTQPSLSPAKDTPVSSPIPRCRLKNIRPSAPLGSHPEVHHDREFIAVWHIGQDRHIFPQNGDDICFELVNCTDSKKRPASPRRTIIQEKKSEESSDILLRHYCWSLLRRPQSRSGDPDEVKEYDAKSQEAIATFKEQDPTIQKFFDVAPGYVVIPTVGKGGIGIGGARGKGYFVRRRCANSSGYTYST